MKVWFVGVRTLLNRTVPKLSKLAACTKLPSRRRSVAKNPVVLKGTPLLLAQMTVNRVKVCVGLTLRYLVTGTFLPVDFSVCGGRMATSNQLLCCDEILDAHKGVLDCAINYFLKTGIYRTQSGMKTEQAGPRHAQSRRSVKSSLNASVDSSVIQPSVLEMIWSLSCCLLSSISSMRSSSVPSAMNLCTCTSFVCPIR
jgi:hypothetical protein